MDLLGRLDVKGSRSGFWSLESFQLLCMSFIENWNGYRVSMPTGDQSVEVTTIMEEHYDETVGL